MARHDPRFHSRRRQKASPRRQRQRQRLRQPRHKPLTAAEHFLTLFRWLLPDSSPFASLTFYGNTSWKPDALVLLALIHVPDV